MVEQHGLRADLDECATAHRRGSFDSLGKSDRLADIAPPILTRELVGIELAAGHG
jgi:hypothetical protein